LIELLTEPDLFEAFREEFTGLLRRIVANDGLTTLATALSPLGVMFAEHDAHDGVDHHVSKRQDDLRDDSQQHRRRGSLGGKSLQQRSSGPQERLPANSGGKPTKNREGYISGR